MNEGKTSMKTLDSLTRNPLWLIPFLIMAEPGWLSAQDIAEKGDRLDIRTIIEEAIRTGNSRLAEEGDRVPGLTYEDIARIAADIPGNVQIPDPTSGDYSSRAISVPGGLVSGTCKHFARSAIANHMFAGSAGMSPDEALAKVTGHLFKQRVIYAKVAGADGLRRSEVADHDAECPVCGPLNAAEIECHKFAVKNAASRDLVMFDYASDVLRGGYRASIRKVKKLLDEDDKLQVALIGRASIPGGPVPNFTLSAKRITSVWGGLTRVGVPVDRIVAIPIGEDEPHIDLQLAIEYGLADDFAAFGQQPLNQSVYMVAFRPSEAMALTSATYGMSPAAPSIQKQPVESFTAPVRSLTDEQKSELFQQFLEWRKLGRPVPNQ